MFVEVDLRKIRFGTDGVRGYIDYDFNEKVVAAVAEATLRYFSRKRDIHKVIVGYDTRRKAELYARIIVNICKAHDIEVALVQEPTPTPVVSWAVREYRYDLAFQVTASHNPPEYGGLKVINWHGASIPDEDARGIEEILQKETEDIEEITQTLEIAMPDVILDLRRPYIEYVVSQIGKVEGKKLRICFDPLYGTTVGYTDEILRQLGHEVVTIHGTRDPNFGGLIPNPEGESIAELRKMVVEQGFDLGIAHDGDGDRLAVVLSNGSELGGNELLVLLLYHYAQEKRVSSVARTVATTHLVDKICREFGIQVIETPVGIKYIAELLIQGKADLGGEESGGVAMRWHVPEKDGIYTAAVIASIASKRDLREILQEIYTRFGKPYYLKRSVEVNRSPREVFSEKREVLKEKLSQIAEVDHVVEIDGLKLVYRDLSWVLVRPSGTEPVIRIYCESTSRELCEKAVSVAAEILKS